MTTLIWASPLLVVVLLLATGRADTMIASAIGVGLALAVSLSFAPIPLSFTGAGREIAKGGWLGWLAGSVIFGGLFFQQVLRSEAAEDGEAAVATPPAEAELRRRQLFAA